MKEALPAKGGPITCLKRVAVLVDTATTWGRGIVEGIHRHARAQRGWQLFVEARGVNDDGILPRGWRGEGIIARIACEETKRKLRKLRIPTVNVSSIQLKGFEFPRVANDCEAVGRLAAEYFMDRGFHHFAYLLVHRLEYVARQCEAFRGMVNARGFACSVHGVQVHQGYQQPDWNLDLSRLAAWLVSLPKPVAILTWSGGREVIHACLKAGLRVPEEVSLLSGTEDELLCKCSPVPISGIQAACEEIGSEAAALLGKLMDGGGAPKMPRYIAPVRVVTRQSTDTIAIPDRALVAALEYIREHAASPIAIPEVARHAGISRRGLERRFMEVLGRTPVEHVTGIRLDHLKRLLVETDLAIADLAERCGFCSPEYMTYVFRKTMGLAPLRYRRERRGQ